MLTHNTDIVAAEAHSSTADRGRGIVEMVQLRERVVCRAERGDIVQQALASAVQQNSAAGLEFGDVQQQ